MASQLALEITNGKHGQINRENCINKTNLQEIKKKKREQECKEKSQIRSEFLLITSNKQEYRTKQKNILQLDQVKAGELSFHGLRSCTMSLNQTLTKT